MRIGGGQALLKIPLGLPMGGYLDRRGTAQYVLDPLYVQAILVQDEVSSWGLSVFDLLGVPEGFSPNWDDIDIIIPAATHTHSAPQPELVREALERASHRAFAQAHEDLDDVVALEVQRFPVEGVCSRRDVPCDESEGIVEAGLIVWRRRRRPPIVFLIFPCHPTVLGPDNLGYSADLAGYLRRVVAKRFRAFTVFLNSCAGNISTHCTRTARTVEEMWRLAGSFLSQIPHTAGQKIAFRPLKWWTAVAQLPLAQRRVWVVPKDERALLGMRLANQRRCSDFERFKYCPLALVQFGDFALLFLPFEVFYETGQYLLKIMYKNISQPSIVGYALAYRPYVVPKGRRGVYEWFASVYREDAEEILAEEVRKLLCTAMG